MKAIIDRKRYDTEKAELIAEYRNGLPVNDFGYYEESLYKTKKGNWFIYGSGNAGSPYSVPEGNNASIGGCKIVPLNKDQAAQWLEDHAFLDELEEHFGPTIEEA